MKDPNYVDFDADESWPGESYQAKARPKWQKPKNQLAIDILDAVGRTYYQSREEQFAVNDIVRQALSMEGGIIVRYPVEWIQACCDYVRKQRSKEKPVPYQLKGLITIIRNAERKKSFILEWKRTHMDIYIASEYDDRSSEDT